MAEIPTPGLGRAIAVRRTELALKRRELADRAELSYPYISEIENSLKEPSSGALRRIADALESEPALLLAQASQYADEPLDALPTTLLYSMATPAPDRGQRAARVSHASRLDMASGAKWEPTRDALEDLIRQTVRRELESWAAYRLPELIREELMRSTGEPPEDPAT